MTERLKQIWGGFSGTTTRRLTGGGVENIHVPSRRDYASSDSQFLPEDFTPPAEAAFTALRARLAHHAGKASARNGRKAQFAPPPAPLTAEAEDEAAPEVARDLVRGLKATEARVSRRFSDYGETARAAAGQALRAGRRKKFLGIF